MPGVSLVGVHKAGHTIVGEIQSFVFTDGSPISVVGDLVAQHPPCPQEQAHCSATMQSGSTLTFIDSVPIERAGDPATCGHVADGLDWFDDGG